MKRRGIALLETAVAAAVLAATTAVCLQLLAAQAAQQRAVRQREAAIREAANVLERAAAVPFDELTPERLAEIGLSPEAAAVLSEGELTVGLAAAPDDVAARRITVSIRWRDHRGEWHRPVQLATWRTQT